MASTGADAGRPWLQALGLGRPELRAWAMYDWANSAFATTIMAAVLPIYFADVAAADLPQNLRTAYWGYTTSAALLITAVLAPVLGAMADYLGAKKRFLAGFAAIGILASACLYLVSRGEWLLAAILFVLGDIGFAGGNVFYESLLPHVAREHEVDRVSTAGYAMGYVGGGVLLAVNLFWILSPTSFGLSDAGHASRLAFLSVAIWWALFSIPVFRSVAEPAGRLEADETRRMNPLRVGFTRVVETFREIRLYRHTFLFLIAFWFYNDGIGTIIKMATIYGREIGIGTNHLIGALLLVQFVGIPFTFAFGPLAARLGAKNGLYLTLCVYTGISVLGYFMTVGWHFWLLALAVGMVQGGSQALSRSIYASMIPRGRSSEFFGFYSVSSKFAGILGPALFALVAQLAGGSRLSILSLIVFFVGGMLLLTRVDVDEGRRIARAEDEKLRPASVVA
ncbi:MAG: MFS transporter [Gemmatimonadetes bacterium]|nr:MFS transporter [Gemmatimonadota bacterium]